MATSWNVDKMHSEISFRVRHMMISNVSGNFEEFSSSIHSDSEDLEGTKIVLEATIDSISTGVSDRDGHLKSADFFDSASFPKISFSAEKIHLTENTKQISGLLEIKGIKKTILLDTEISPIVVDPYGQTKIGISFTGKLSRKEFDLSWNAVTEAGNIVVGDEIKLAGELQFIKQN